MQPVNAAYQAVLDNGEGRDFLDLFEFYDTDAVPGATGFDPADAEETFAGSEITYNGIAYRSSVISRGEISRSMGEKTNSVTITFSNIDRYVATWAQTQQIEGKIGVIRGVSPDVTDDHLVEFVGRCGKPGDIDKKTFSLTIRQDFGNINVTVPTSQYVAEDPNGLQPDNPLYEGIRFVPMTGMTNPTGGSPGRSGLLGALLGGVVGFLLWRKKKVAPTSSPWSSYDFTPYGQVVSEIFGTVQMQAVPIMFADTGYWLNWLGAWCKGSIQGVTNITMKNFTAYGLFDVQTHTGELGGTGDAIVRNGLVPQTGGNITEDFRFPGSGLFSLLAFSGISILQSGINDEPVAIDEPPMIVGLVQGRKVDLPDGSGVYNRSEWSDNPVHIARFILTNSRFANINPAFMDDAAFYRAGLHCDEPLIDTSNTQTILIPAVETDQAGVSFKRHQTSALYTPETVKYFSGDLTEEPAPVPNGGGPYTPLPAPPTPIPTSFPIVPVLLKRYTANFSISEEVKAVDLVYKTIFPTAKLYMKVGKNAKIGPYSEKAADSTKVRTATVVGATSIPVLDVIPWKTGPDLLTGRLLTGWNLTTSEVRDLVSAVYSTSGNSLTLAAADTGTTTLAASGATLSGGSTSVQASGTLTVGGTPAAGDTITGTIDGVDVEYTLTAADTTETAAAMLAAYINATVLLKPYIKASWLAASPTVVTIKCLHGALNLSSTTGFPTLRIAHDVGEEVMRIAMSFSTNSQDLHDAWKPNTLVLLNSFRLPTVLNGRVYKVTTEGTTGATEPTWPTATGGTVASGTAVFTEYQSSVLGQAGLNRSNVVKDSFKWPLGSTESSVNQIKGKFRDKVNDFAETPFKINDTDHHDQVKKWLPKDVDYTAVDNWHQVFRLGKGELSKRLEGNHFHALETGPQGLPLEEGDLIASSDDSGGLINVVTRIEDLSIKPNHHVAIQKSRLYSTNMFSDDVTATPILIPSTLRHTQTVDSVIAFIDNFALYDADVLIPGFYVGVSRDLGLIGDWRGWKLYADYGDGYVKIADGDIAATMGTADTILGSADSEVFDTAQVFTSVFGTDIITCVGHHFANGNSVRVSNSGGALPPPLAANTTYFVRDVSGDTFKLAATAGGAAIDLITNNGTGTHSVRNVLSFTLKFGTPEPAPEPFATVTEADLVANPRKNLFQCGSEYIQVATVVSNGDQSYTVSDFYRGRFETELTHVADEDVVFLNGAEVFVKTDIARIGIEYPYKAVTTNQNISEATPVLFTWLGKLLADHKVTDLNAVRDASGNWYGSSTGHPRQLPANYIARWRRTSDGVIMRDIPIATGTTQSAVFGDTVGDMAVTNNNLLAGAILPFTAVSGTDVITCTGHPFSDGSKVRVTNLGGALPASLLVDTDYFWRDNSGDTGKLAATLGGAAIDLTTDGSGTSSIRSAPFVTAKARTSQEITEPGAFFEFVLPALDTLAGGSISLAFFHSADAGWTAASAWTVGVYTLRFAPKDVATGEWGIYFYDVGGESAGQVLLENVSLGLGEIKIRTTFLGTQLSVFKNWINSSSEPLVVSKVPPADHFPMKAAVYLITGAVNSDAARIEQAVIGGMVEPSTIYSKTQQDHDDPVTDMATIDLEMFQISTVEGRKVRLEFP